MREQRGVGCCARRLQPRPISHHYKFALAVALRTRSTVKAPQGHSCSRPIAALGRARGVLASPLVSEMSSEIEDNAYIVVP